jgi:hypothetical protein
MQFDLRITDPPSSYGAMVLAGLLVLGTVLGLVSVYARCLKRIVGVVDLAAWAVGLLAGVVVGFVANDAVLLGGRLLTLACMGAGLWLSVRRSRDLGVVGLRVLESAAFAAIAALTADIVT